jgi:GAF domain-containing protein
VDARYGALGILDESAQGLQDFLFVGLTDEEAERIGALPVGRGLLGHLIEHPSPVRVPDIRTDPRASGTPAHHPPMTTFLGVPIRVRGEVFGNLYLTDKQSDTPFTTADEALATTLAAVAGVAVENFRLHGRVSELAALETRERIAREMHDTVIQRIFSIGLALEGIASRADAALAEDLERAAADLDDTVQQIRTAIFVGAQNDDSGQRPVARELAEYLTEITEPLGTATTVRFAGRVDELVEADAADATAHVIATLFAASRDVVRALHQHQPAEHLAVAVTIGTDLTLRVRADGDRSGPAPTMEAPDLEDPALEDLDLGELDLDDLAARTREVGGRMTAARSAAGPEITWSVPLTRT